MVDEDFVSDAKSIPSTTGSSYVLCCFLLLSVFYDSFLHENCLLICLVVIRNLFMSSRMCELCMQAIKCCQTG